MFDSKPEVADLALYVYRRSREVFVQVNPRQFYGSTIAFGNDEEHEPLQAADFMAYEWRKRISDSRLKPQKEVRRSYKRIREARNEGALWRFGPEALQQPSDMPKLTWRTAFVGQRPTTLD